MVLGKKYCYFKLKKYRKHKFMIYIKYNLFQNKNKFKSTFTHLPNLNFL